MVEEQPVEEHLVGVLERAEIDVLVERRRARLEGFVRAGGLLFERLDLRRAAGRQAELASFLLGEGGALGAKRIIQ
jgi:hypothetical protein